MGLTTWKNAPDGRILKSDVIVAKNYLDSIEKLDEAQALAIVTNWVKNQWERDLVDKEILEDIKTTVSSTDRKSVV